MWYELRPLSPDLNDGLWFDPQTGEFVEIENAHPDILCTVLIKKGHGHVGSKRLKEMMELYPDDDPGIGPEDLDSLIRKANKDGFEGLPERDREKLLNAAYFIWETGGIAESPRWTTALLDARCPDQSSLAASLKKMGMHPVVSLSPGQTITEILWGMLGISTSPLVPIGPRTSKEQTGWNAKVYSDKENRKFLVSVHRTYGDFEQYGPRDLKFKVPKDISEEDLLIEINRRLQAKGESGQLPVQINWL